MKIFVFGNIKITSHEIIYSNIKFLYSVEFSYLEYIFKYI